MRGECGIDSPVTRISFVRTSIVDPNTYIEKGYQPNIMPSTFKSLPKQQLDALVQFLIGGKK